MLMGDPFGDVVLNRLDHFLFQLFELVQLENKNSVLETSAWYWTHPYDRTECVNILRRNSVPAGSFRVYVNMQKEPSGMQVVL